MVCKSTLEALSRGGVVYLAWMPGHTGVSGNMEADRLAGLGTREPLSGSEPNLL